MRVCVEAVCSDGCKTSNVDFSVGYRDLLHHLEKCNADPVAIAECFVSKVKAMPPPLLILQLLTHSVSVPHMHTPAMPVETCSNSWCRFTHTHTHDGQKETRNMFILIRGVQMLNIEDCSIT